MAKQRDSNDGGLDVASLVQRAAILSAPQVNASQLTASASGVSPSAPAGGHQVAHQPGPPLPRPPDHIKEAYNTLILLSSCAVTWLACSYIDATYTPRDANYLPSRSLIISYQWCMVGYASNLILTLLKTLFETNRSKLKLHMVSCYINILAATSYAMLWTGFSPIVPDVASCLYIPQRWMLYCFTAPAIIYILCQISDYTPRMRVWVIMLNVFMLAAGGLGTVPWISWPHKVYWYVMSCVPFPSILVHMWRMVSSAVDETGDPTSKRAIKFIRIFSITTWNLFPFVYFAAIDGALSLEISEPMWAALDWLTKMVYSSSLMEANFFTIAQRREFTVRAIEEANRLATIQQLSTAIERKDDFLSAMSHELRTPLNGIIGLSDSLMAGACGQLPDKAVKTISTVKLSGKRLLQLINDILDAAKMKQGTLVIKHEKVDIKRLATDVLDLSLPLVRKGVKLVNNVGNVPKIVGDNGRIVQILYNLVGNAAKFTRQGVISITAGVSEDCSKVYVTVSDTGVGIPKEKVSKIFGAFEQADMSTTRRYGGTGLGLHLVKELIKAHNGDISVESEVGVGSSFTVWLPISQDGAVMPVDESEAREPYALGFNEPLRRISEDSDGGVSGAGMGEGGQRPGSASARRKGPGGADGEDGGPAGSSGPAANSGASGPGSVRVSSANGSGVAGGTGLAAAAAGNTSSENLLTVTKAGFKVMKPFYREKFGGCMVLSVDDDPINQMVVENLLSPEGYRVEQAMSGSEALEFLQKTATLPDVILLDIMMPDMSGYEVCQEIRRRYSAVSVPIIMVSAKGHPEHVMKGLEAGSVDYVKKPFHRQELLSRIRAQVRHREIFEAEMESRKVTEMLKRILPLSVVQRLQQGQSMIADAHDEVTVLFAGVAGFLAHQSLTARNTGDVVLVLNEMYAAFEKLLLKHQVFRVEHTGESYLVVSGHDGSPDHVRRMLALASDMLAAVQMLTFPTGQPLRIRVGLHTGPAYAGVVGIDNPRYCVFGDTVSAANALEMRGFANTVHCSNTVYAAALGRDKDRGNSGFVAARKGMDAGPVVMDTYLYKVGSWEAAIKSMEDEEREREAAEREMAEKEAAVKRKAVAAESQAAAASEAAAQVALQAERARADALMAQVVTLASEKEVAQAQATAAQAAVDVLRKRMAGEEVERQRMAASLVAYERQLAEAREAVVAAAAEAAARGSAAPSTAPSLSGVSHAHLAARPPLDGGLYSPAGWVQQHAPYSQSPYPTGAYPAGPGGGPAPQYGALPPAAHRTLSGVSSPAGSAAARDVYPPAHRLPHPTAYAPAYTTPLGGDTYTVAGAAGAYPGALHAYPPGLGAAPPSPLPGAVGRSAVTRSASIASSAVPPSVGGALGPGHGLGASRPGSDAGSSAMGAGLGLGGPGGSAASFWNVAYPIERFLQDIGLPQYEALMRSQEVTPLVLAGMRDPELEALGVETLGARRRIREAAKEYASRVRSTVRMMALSREGQALAQAGSGSGLTGAPPSPPPEPLDALPPALPPAPLLADPGAAHRLPSTLHSAALALHQHAAEGRAAAAAAARDAQAAVQLGLSPGSSGAGHTLDRATLSHAPVFVPVPAPPAGNGWAPGGAAAPAGAVQPAVGPVPQLPPHAAQAEAARVGALLGAPLDLQPGTSLNSSDTTRTSTSDTHTATTTSGSSS